MTSDHEGLPMILLEAMAVNTPVIAHAVGGIPKLLDNGSSGILVHGHQASDYADAIYRLAKSPQTRTSITRNAFNRVATDYSAELNARKYLDEYFSISRQRH
jgi:glycosyltransferase involved in cell wall biosynthesis